MCVLPRSLICVPLALLILSTLTALHTALFDGQYRYRAFQKRVCCLALDLETCVRRMANAFECRGACFVLATAYSCSGPVFVFNHRRRRLPLRQGTGMEQIHQGLLQQTPAHALPPPARRPEQPPNTVSVPYVCAVCCVRVCFCIRSVVCVCVCRVCETCVFVFLYW